MQQFSTRWCVPLLTVLLLLLPLVLGANDPGHDSLYVLKNGDSVIIGSINLTANVTAGSIRAATLFYGDLIDIRGNGSINSVTSRPAIQADANDLYLDAKTNIYLATKGGTTNTIQFGPTTGSAITLNVSGTLLQQGITVCLQNGTNCPGTLASSNVTGSGTTSTLARWTSTANIGTSIITDTGTTVGVSTSTPAEILHVTGNARLGQGPASLTNLSDSSVNSTVTTINVTNTTGYPTTGTVLINTEAMTYTGTTAASFTGATRGALGTTAASHSSGSIVNSYLLTILTNSTSPKLIVTANGSVGIGTATPQTKLEVLGTINATAIKVGSTNVCLADGTNCPASGTSSGWVNTSGSGNISMTNTAANVSANTLFIDNTNTRVGIGTQSPTAGLELLKSSTSNQTNAIAARIAFTDNGNISGGSTIRRDGLSIISNSTGNITNNGGVINAGLRIVSAGNYTTEPLGNSQESITVDGADITSTYTSGTALDSQDTPVVQGISVTATGNIDPNFDNPGGHIAGSFTASGTAPTNKALQATASGATNNYGVIISASGGTNNYGLQITNPTSGTSNYAIYSTATAQSYFAGNIGIGTTTPVQKLDVIGTVNATSFTGAGTGLSGTAASLTAGTATTASNLASGLYSYNAGAIVVNANVSNNATQFNGFSTTFFLNTTGFSAGNVTSGTLSVTRGGTGVATSTGTDSVVLNNSPTISGTGTLIASTIKVGSNNVCQSDGTNCPAGATGNSGWLNGTTQVYLANNNTNVSVGYVSSQPVLFIDTANSKIGIGSPSPVGKLEVNGTNSTPVLRLTTSSNTTNLTSDAPLLELLNTNVSTNQTVTNSNYVRIDFSTINTTGNKFAMASIVGIYKNHSNATTSYNGQLAFFTNGAGTLTERLRIDENGNVGINTSTPTTALQVTGTITATTFSGAGTSLTGTAASLTAGTATALAANGANCASGTYPLGVDASGAAESCGSNINGNAGTATTASNLANGLYSYNTGAIVVNANVSNNATQFNGFSTTFFLNATGFNAGNITAGTLAVARGGTGVTTSTGSGNVVLSASPTFTGTISASALTATAAIGGDSVKAGSGSPGNATGTGDIYATSDIEYDGNLYGPGADLAERINASEPLDPGDVVEADSTRPETVRRSRAAYNTAVIGIISTDPSIILSKSKGTVPLALAGRVPIKVSAENGPIVPGDLLTTSATPGYAMKCEDRQRCHGALVAKSLGTLASGTGTITGVVTLG